MKQKTLSILLRVITAFLMLGAIVFYYPFMAGEIIAVQFCWTEMTPYIGFLIVNVYATAIPVFTALVLFWLICVDIGRDKSFRMTNSKRMFWIGMMALIDTGLVLVFFIFSIIVEACDLGTVLFTFAVGTFGLAISAASFTLSHLVQKACKLQQDADLTV